MHGGVLHEDWLRCCGRRRHRLQLDGQEVGRDNLHKLKLVVCVRSGSDLDLGDLVTNLMGLGMMDSLCLCCRSRLEEGVVWLELHDLELRGSRLRRLDCDWRSYGHRCRYLTSFRNASGQARIGIREEILLLLLDAQLFVLSQLLG